MSFINFLIIIITGQVRADFNLRLAVPENSGGKRGISLGSGSSSCCGSFRIDTDLIPLGGLQK
jgi:hypothetical protein